MDRLYVATRKGLFTVDRNGGRDTIELIGFEGDPVIQVLPDPRDGSLYAALDHPDVFGMAGMQSFWLQRAVAEDLIEKIGAGASPRPHFNLIWNRYDLYNPDFSVDLRADSMRVAEAIRAQGFDLTGGEVVEGAGWGSWRAHAGDMLETFFPME